MEQITGMMKDLLAIEWVRAGLIVAGSVVAAFLVRAVFFRLVVRLISLTRSDVDDRLARVLRGPAVASVVLAGLAWAAVEMGLEGAASFIAMGVIKTLAVVIWGRSLMIAGSILLEALAGQMDKWTWIQPKTEPLLDIVFKVVIIGGSLYLIFLAWNINVTSWLASAGIVGIAVGFAAKDTLANLFAGVFILADAPYKVGDFIILDSGIRGIVSDIGVRSTRLLTRDDIEVTLPNSVIANSSIVNESGGPYQKMRVRVKVAAAYGSDLEKVRNTLQDCAKDIEHISQNPEPRVRFREFGDSGLLFELLAWIEEPVFRGRVLDALNTKVYNRFMEEGIEIPYNKHDIYIKERAKEAA